MLKNVEYVILDESVLKKYKKYFETRKNFYFTESILPKEYSNRTLNKRPEYDLIAIAKRKE